MSQQTRIEVVARRFLEWMTVAPTPGHLADLSEEEVLALWAGLGYYNRARNLHALAKHVRRVGWPDSAMGLKALPGVGEYTAAAVASLALGERVPAIDGNVERVLSRLQCIEGDLRTGQGKKHLAAMASGWVSIGNAGAINEATMELGARLCTPRNPRCDQCPCRSLCKSQARGEVELFPKPRVRRSRVELTAKVLVLSTPTKVLLRRAGADELIAGHWTLPRLEDLSSEIGTNAAFCGVVRHSITHHRIVWEVCQDHLSEEISMSGLEWVPKLELSVRIVSSLPRKALEKSGIRW
jgi:A/G-specific adenine glycosylase